MAETIYAALARMLGREPTNAELKAEITRIGEETLIKQAAAGKLPHQRRRGGRR